MSITSAADTSTNAVSPEFVIGPSVDVAFAGPNLVTLFDGQDEHAAVTDFAGARRLDDRLDAVGHQRILDDHLDFHFRQQTDVVFLAAVDRRVPLLFAVA